MNTTLKQIWRRVNGVKVIVFIAALLLLHSSTVSAQDFERIYERALLDSAYRFELLKPAYVDLKIVTKLQDERYYASEKQRVFEGKLCEMQAKRAQDAERKKRKRLLKIGLVVGVGVGVLIGYIAH